jgi:DNA-binding Lrp family transcriptional regulator
MKKKTVDVTDIEILNILTGHAEFSNKELASRIGLSEGSTLVRVQNLRERGVIKSYAALINFPFFGYSRYYLIRAEVSETDTEELKQRFLQNRYIILLIEMEGTVDLIMRILLGVCQAKSQKVAKDELHKLTTGIKGLKSVTFNAINFINQKALALENQDIVK